MQVRYDDAMADKTISDRLKSLRVYQALVEVSSGEAAERLAELLRPLLRDGESLPDLAHLHDLLVRYLRLLWSELDEMDAAVEDKKQEERKWSRTREAAKETIHDKLLDLKRVLRGILRDEVDDIVRFAKKLPRDEINLAVEAETTLERLREMGDPDDRFDAAKWIGPLEGAHEALVEADDQARLAGKEVESLQAMRRRALHAFGQSFVCIGGNLKESYRLVGMDGPAQAAQPSAKYPGRTMAEVRQLGKAPRKKRRTRKKKT